MGLGKNVTKEKIENQDKGIFSLINKFWGVGLDFARSLGHVSEIFGKDLSNEYRVINKNTT